MGLAGPRLPCAQLPRGKGRVAETDGISKRLMQNLKNPGQSCQREGGRESRGSQQNSLMKTECFKSLLKNQERLLQRR